MFTELESEGRKQTAETCRFQQLACTIISISILFMSKHIKKPRCNMRRTKCLEGFYFFEFLKHNLKCWKHFRCPSNRRVGFQNPYWEQQRRVEQLSEQVFTFHFLCTSMAARMCFQLCSRPSSAPGLSLWLQQLSAMQMEEGAAVVELALSG